MLRSSNGESSGARASENPQWPVDSKPFSSTSRSVLAVGNPNLHDGTCPAVFESVNVLPILRPIRKLSHKALREFSPFLSLEVKQLDSVLVAVQCNNVSAVRRPARRPIPLRSGQRGDLAASQVKDADGRWFVDALILEYDLAPVRRPVRVLLVQWILVSETVWQDVSERGTFFTSGGLGMIFLKDGNKLVDISEDGHDFSNLMIRYGLHPGDKMKNVVGQDKTPSPTSRHWLHCPSKIDTFGE